MKMYLAAAVFWSTALLTIPAQASSSFSSVGAIVDGRSVEDYGSKLYSDDDRDYYLEAGGCLYVLRDLPSRDTLRGSAGGGFVHGFTQQTQKEDPSAVVAYAGEAVPIRRIKLDRSHPHGLKCDPALVTSVILLRSREFGGDGLAIVLKEIDYRPYQRGGRTGYGPTVGLAMRERFFTPSQMRTAGKVTLALLEILRRRR